MVLLLIGGYLAAHCLLRLTLSPALGIDDAEQVLFAQHWAFGYRFQQPPLFTWLLRAVTVLTGPGMLAVGIVRYTLLFLTYLCLYLTALRLIEDRRLAALAVLSYALIYVFAYFAHHDLTHTTALGAMIAACFYLFTRLMDHPSNLNYLLLGLVFGLGVLAKWNFVMLALGLPLACMMMPRFRPLILSRKALLAVVVMIAVILPTAAWMIGHQQTVASLSNEILRSSAPEPSMTPWLEGSWALLRSALLFPMPFLPLFLLVFARPLRAALIAPANTMNGRDLTDRHRLLGLVMVVVMGLHALLIPLFDATAFTERWMHPALMILPLWLFGLLDRGAPLSRQVTVYLVLIALLVATTFGARLYRQVKGAAFCGQCRELIPFADLADGLREAGFEKGTIIADGMHMGGNLAMRFPDSRIVDPAFPAALWPNLVDHVEADSAPTGQGIETNDAGACLLVWRADRNDAERRGRAMRDFAEQTLGAAFKSEPRSNSAHRKGTLSVLMQGSITRRYELGFEILRENQGGCR